MNQDQSADNVADVMRWVLLALLPGLAVFFYFTGWGGVVTVTIAVVAGLLFEALALTLRNQPVSKTLSDYSALVTVVLLALCLPPLMPWWVIVIAVAAAILLAKHAYGGLGQNIFNPAMVGYAVVLISYPLDVSTWVQLPQGFDLTLSQALAYSFTGGLSQSIHYDALTGATALSQYYELSLQSASDSEIADAVRGSFGARHSEWLNLAFLAGGIILLIRRIISWHLPVAVLSGILVLQLLLGSEYPDLWFHWFGGATMLCAFFIVTDPVSAPASPHARLIFGFVIGALIFLIRQYGSYPDSIAFAVLLMNCSVPLLDRFDYRLKQRPQ